MSINISQLTYIHADGEILFRNITFSLSDGEKTALIGDNGSGKTTLLKILANEIKPVSGIVSCMESPHYIPQSMERYNELSVAQAIGMEQKINAFHAILNGDASAENFALLNDDWSIEEKIAEAFAQWEISHIDIFQKMENLSGGEKSRVFLASLSIHDPAVILLDEPTNHLDKKGREQLYHFIHHSKATILLVSHDRDLLNQLEMIIELNKEGMEIYGGNYAFYKMGKEVKLNALQEQLNEKEKALRLAKKVAHETIERQQKQNVRGEKANQKKGLPRIVQNSLKGKAENSTSKLQHVHDSKMENIQENLTQLREKLSTKEELKINIQNTSLHAGKILISANELNFKYNESCLWEENLNIEIRSGERIAVEGDNGKGKTTLLKLFLGELQPSLGNITRADFSYLYIDQEYSVINNELTVYGQMEQYNSGHLLEHELKMLLNRFLFPSPTWDKKCGKLSGGEKMKLLFCCMQAGNNMPDLLVLDEPTNNLDIRSLEITTQQLKNFRGTILVISHDSFFINEIQVDRKIVLI